MVEWEYRVDTTSRSSTPEKAAQEWEIKLNLLSSEGWELVSDGLDGRVDLFHGTFRRPCKS